MSKLTAHDKQLKNDKAIYEALEKLLKAFGKFDLKHWKNLNNDDSRILEIYRHGMEQIQEKYKPKLPK